MKSFEWIIRLARPALIVALVALSTHAGLAMGQDTTPLRTTQPLMQNWLFVQDDTLTDEQALASTGAGWQTVNLPHTWNAEDAASLKAADYKRGLGWYRLTFDTPTAGVRHWLEIGAASLVADVWLNGQHLGQHKGGFTVFRFDVTDVLAAGAPNVLLIKVNNTAPKSDSDITAIAPIRGDFNVSGGLYRYVSLVSTPDAAHIDLSDMGGPGVYAATTSIAEGAATVNVRTKLKSDATAAVDYTVRTSLLDAGGQVAATAQQTVSLAPGAAAEVSQDLNVPSAHLWNGVADPYLYQLVSELITSAGAPVDKLVQSFGIRQMSFDPDQGFFLNGQHVRLNGAAMHQDLLGKAWAISDADMDNSLAMIREMGANAARFGHYPFSYYAYQRASELGLVVWSEAALGVYTTIERCSQHDAAPEFVDNAKQQLQEQIRQHYNHASIAMWAVGNESTQGQTNCKQPYDNVTPVLREMNATAKAEDPTRPTAYAEFPHPVKRSGPFATEGITDLFATNRYFLWYTVPFALSQLLDDLHALTPKQPLGVSEYGGGAALTHHTDNPLGGRPEVRSAATAGLLKPRHQAEQAQGNDVSYQPEEYASYLHEENYRVIANKPYLWGSFIWNMFDFGSAHRNEGDVLGVNTKGLVTFDHQTRKDPFYFYKANWGSEPVTYITGRRYTDRAYPVADVKVYSNADSIELSVNGAVVGTMTADQCEQRTCVFRNVTLSQGVNTLTAMGNHAGTPVGDTVEWTLNVSGINIAAGRLATGYVSSDGTHFGSDNFFTGGATRGLGPVERGGAPDVSDTKDPLLYKYRRIGHFHYDVPLADGAYEITLGFVEANPALAVGDRRFNVTANGQPLLTDFDIRKTAGGASVAVTRTFTVNVSGGVLTLAFEPIAGNATVSYIEIHPVAQ